ncbi:MAG: dihydrofolate reductase family protein [Actinomycetota bacterium]
MFVLTHEARERLTKKGRTTFTFVTDGIERALERAGAGAGDKDVSIAGGANLVRQYLKAGLVDELQIHLMPVLVGDGSGCSSFSAPSRSSWRSRGSSRARASFTFASTSGPRPLPTVPPERGTRVG